MRANVPLAAVGSVPAALLAHALDASGRLPFVHESDAVRAAMGPGAVALWLALTALVVGLAAASRRPALLAAPASLASAGLPELIGRHDLGAVLEPGAMLGALLQWLLLLVALALAVAASRMLRLTPFAAGTVPPRTPPLPSRPCRSPYVAPRWRLRSRAPPATSFPLTIFNVQEGHFMHAPPVRRLAALAVAVPLVVGVVGCSSDGDKGNATAACSSDISKTASTQLPSDVPSPSGAASAYNYSSQGKTQVWFFALNGSPDDLASLRDAYDTQLTGKGYKIEGTDQEEGAEAESEFSGPHEGTTNFKALCTGKVDFRLKLTS